jgi:hypothetical protein
VSWRATWEAAAVVGAARLSIRVLGANEAAPVSHTVTTQPLADTELSCPSTSSSSTSPAASSLCWSSSVERNARTRSLCSHSSGGPGDATSTIESERRRGRSMQLYGTAHYKRTVTSTSPSSVSWASFPLTSHQRNRHTAHSTYKTRCVPTQRTGVDTGWRWLSSPGANRCYLTRSAGNRVLRSCPTS